MWQQRALWSSSACPLWPPQWESGQTAREQGKCTFKVLVSTRGRCFKAGCENYLFFLNDVDAGLDVGEGVHGGEDGLPLILLVEFASRSAALGEGRGVHEAPQVEIFLKVCHSVFHFIVVEEWLHKSDLDVSLDGRK